jgi:molybdenum cofactor biosynthesis enzyme MoaA
MQTQAKKKTAGRGALLTKYERKHLAKKLDGTTHIKGKELRHLSEKFFPAFAEKIATDLGEKKTLGGTFQDENLESRKRMIKRIVRRLEERTGVKYKLGDDALEGGKKAFDKALENIENQLRVSIENGKANFDSGSGLKIFSAGDKIHMNSRANEKYNITKKGSEGEVIKSEGGDHYLVKFSLQTGDRSSQNVWKVNARYMEHRSLKGQAKKAGGADKFASEIVRKCVAEIIADKKKDDFADLFITDLLEDKFLIKLDGRYGVNLNRAFELTGGKLAKAYADPTLYSTPDMASPPSERKRHVLRLELTQGCDYNGCTYCDVYKKVPYKEKTFDEFMDHYKAVKKALGDNWHEIRRLFIGGGNALNVDLKVLVKAVRFLYREFEPRRISIYGRADAIREKGKSGLYELRQNGLNLIYWGVESGSADVLKYVRKKTNPDEMISACHAAGRAGISLSIMVMPGLGGIRHSESHVDGTVRFLNEVGANYITFMAINPPKGSVYAKHMAEEIKAGKNRPLTDREIVEQLKEIMKGMESRGQKIGMFDQTIDQVGASPLNFNVEFGYSGKREALQICDNYLKKSK